MKAGLEKRCTIRVEVWFIVTARLWLKLRLRVRVRVRVRVKLKLRIRLW